MSDTITQLPVASAKGDFYPQATLRLSPEDTAGLDDVRFERDCDDLDHFEAAALRIDSVSDTTEDAAMLGAELQLGFSSSSYVRHWPSSPPVPDATLMFLLHRYDREPKDRLTILLPSDLVSAADISHALRRILRAFHLPAGALAWQREDAPAS